MYYMPYFWWQYERPSLTMKLVFLIVIIIISLTDGRYSKTWTQVDLDDTDPQIKPSKFSFNWIWEIFKLDFIFFIHAVQKVTTGEIPAFYEEIIQERRNKLAMQKFRNILLVSFVCWPIGTLLFWKLTFFQAKLVLRLNGKIDINENNLMKLEITRLMYWI